MSHADDGARFVDIDATSETFRLLGGRYGACAVAADFGGGTVKLERLGPDGATWVSVSADTDFDANAYAVVDLVQGEYRFAVETTTGVSADIYRMPF